MKLLLSLVLVGLTGCSYFSSSGEKVYLKHSLKNQFTYCEEGFMGAYYNALEYCISQKESQGYYQVEVTEFASNGYPIKYHSKKDVFWPDN